MTLNLTVPPQTHADFSPKITVIGVGGGGTNAVDNMIASNLEGVEFVVANTDAQSLAKSLADSRIQLGPHLTHGLGAGAKPEVGRAAAEEAADEIARYLDGAHMVFITTGMGGGTGTGAAPVIARMARERNILTIGVVSKPFAYEGKRRARVADEGIQELQQYVDTLIVIPNQNLFRIANERTTLREAYKLADEVLNMGVRGVTDLMMERGYVNLDFADIRSVMAEMGKAMMGTGEAEGDNRAVEAAEAAISNPLLEDTCMATAKGLLVNVTGGEDMTFFEAEEAFNRICREVPEDANMIFGTVIEEKMSGRLRVSVVATGIDVPSGGAERPHLAAVETEAQPEQPYAAPSAQPSAAPAAQQMQPPVAQQPAAAPQPQAYAPPPGHAAPPAHTVPGQVAAAAAQPRQPAPAPAPAPAASKHANLFSEPPRPSAYPAQDPNARSLFGRVTGAFRRATTPETRQEPVAQSQPTISQAEQGSTRHGEGDNGLEIPTFLRR
ncbi:cell division protein FtsZ [Acetobacter lambici]|uniref:Cell division protein FtsZ n=1 Tax=Acetobacter lambici TaxID=1332824 RepID=A0ABT1F0F3_9PROT|nr:cell division protein FtsZ [Acetobacter lambici]MCP1242458.1 cell division protein FtsZ [Acetobacter lambici]MCP1258677.1 cell division protein FtsZ [Acetobacter lambici]NHO56938.1 cell division protein FtsZ [Acetobacter lambici]